MAVTISWFFLLCLLGPFVIGSFLGAIGHGFIIYDAENDEELFDDLWQNQAVCIASVKKRESVTHKGGVPEIMVTPYNQDWREEIGKSFDE